MNKAITSLFPSTLILKLKLNNYYINILSISELKVLTQQQVFLKNHARNILFMSVYVQNHRVLKFSLQDFMSIS